VSKQNSIEFLNWGEVDYVEAASNQLSIVNEVAAGAPDQIIFCTHPPVVTLGRFRGQSDLEGWRGEVVESTRGGRATYHGPNQIVVYPIINLTRERNHLRTRDIAGYLKALGGATVAALKSIGVECELRQGQDTDDEGLKRELTGLWIGSRKIASMGVAVKKWTTYHGIAINVDRDPNAFQGIRPCGFQSSVMASMEETLGQRPDRVEVEEALKRELKQAFALLE